MKQPEGIEDAKLGDHVLGWGSVHEVVKIEASPDVDPAVVHFRCGVTTTIGALGRWQTYYATTLPVECKRCIRSKAVSAHAATV